MGPQWKSCRAIILALSAAVALAVPVVAGLAPDAMAAAPATLTGSLPDGAAYLIQVPDNWNGTLVLYSHGIVIPGSPNPARDVGDPLTGQYLLGHGYALAGSSYATTGWAVQDGLADQIATLDVFGRLVGHPGRTIAWGHSLGGMITAGLLQRYPDRFAGALPMCGPVGGSVGTWNQALDAEVVFQQLLAPPGPLQLVRITDPAQDLKQADCDPGPRVLLAQKGVQRFGTLKLGKIVGGLVVAWRIEIPDNRKQHHGFAHAIERPIQRQPDPLVFLFERVAFDQLLLIDSRQPRQCLRG